MARVPFGYRDEGHRLVVDDQAAAIVQRIFAEFTRPYIRAGLSEIATGLNVDEVPTQRGGKWYASTVRYILSNQVYAGSVVSHELFDRAQGRLASMRMGPSR